MLPVILIKRDGRVKNFRTFHSLYILEFLK